MRNIIAHLCVLLKIEHELQIRFLIEAKSMIDNLCLLNVFIAGMILIFIIWVYLICAILFKKFLVGQEPNV